MNRLRVVRIACQSISCKPKAKVAGRLVELECDLARGLLTRVAERLVWLRPALMGRTR